jgi:uroporphyrinogen-III synthase
VLAPVLRIAATGEPAPQERFDAVALTSANAVPALASLRDRIGGAALFAVGRRTADAMDEAGLPAPHVAQGEGRSLADLVAATLPPGATVLHVAGRDRKTEPAASLEERGIAVVVWTAYAALAVPELPQAARLALEQRTVEAALQYSRRTAETLMALAAGAGCFVPLLSLRHACLSTTPRLRCALPVPAASLWPRARTRIPCSRLSTPGLAEPSHRPRAGAKGTKSRA